MGRSTRELQDRGSSAAGREGGDGILHGDELGVLVAAEITVVSAETALPHHADAVDRIVGGVVVPVRDGPGSEDAVGLGSEAGIEDDAGGVAWLANIGTGEVDGGAGRAGERGEAEEGGDEIAAAVVGGERIAALGNGQRAEAFADVFAGEARVNQDTAAHGDGRAVAHAVVVHELGIPVGVDRERRVVKDQLRGIEERTVILQRVATTEEGGDAAVAQRTGHFERIAADAAEIDVSSRGRTVETGTRSGKVGDEVAGPGRAGDEAAAVDGAAVQEVTDELREAVEVEGATVGVHEILLAGAIDGVIETEPDRAARDVGGGAVVLAAIEQQGTRAHLREGAAGGDLAGQVDGDAVHDLEEAGNGRGGGAELEAGDRQRVGDGRRTGGATEEQVAGGEAERGELRTGDVARSRVGHGERVQGRTQQAEIVTRRGGGNLRGGSRHQGGVGEGGGRGVIRESDDGSAGGGSDGEVLSRGGGRGVGAEDEGGAVRDRSDGRVSRDVGADDAHAGDESGGASDGHVRAAASGRTREQVDGARVSGEIIASDADAAFDALAVIVVGRGDSETDLVTDAEAGDAVEIQHGAGVMIGDRSEREDVIAGPGHQDAARAFFDAQGTRGLTRAGGVADEAEKTAVDEGDGTAGDAAADDVLGGIIEGELGLIADAHARADACAQVVERAGAADDGDTTVHAQLPAEGVGGGQVERTGTAIVE